MLQNLLEHAQSTKTADELGDSDIGQSSRVHFGDLLFDPILSGPTLKHTGPVSQEFRVKLEHAQS